VLRGLRPRVDTGPIRFVPVGGTSEAFLGSLVPVIEVIESGLEQFAREHDERIVRSSSHERRLFE
jgi:hypothetical protein